MNAKQLLIMLLSGTLSLGLVGCNESLEENTTENPTAPDGGDSGDNTGDNGTGEDGGGGNSGNNGDGTVNIGTWENKDEDADGVPDDQDDYPFDPSASEITITQEAEFNNNVAEANVVGEVPFKSAGAISTNVDIDDFKFSVPSNMLDENLSVTFVLFKSDSRFTPTLTILNNEGDVISSIETNIDHVGKIGQAITFSPSQAGEYNLSITDKNGLGDTSFSYSVDAFIDVDKDGVADEKESALGMLATKQDTDGDNITDGNEYHVYTSDFSFIHDADADEIPNWLDDDSDNDGITDDIELTYDYDNDGMPAFIDLDSDNNGTQDATELSLVEFIRYDQDSDGIPNFVDIDDDGDFLFDKFDATPSVPLESITESYPTDTPLLTSITYSHNDQAVFINKVSAFYPANLNGENLKGSEIYLVTLKGDDVEPIKNEKVTLTSDEQINIVIPNYASIELGGEPLSFFLVIDGYKTNTIDAELLHPNTPLITNVSSTKVVAGDTVTLIGENYDSETTVNFVDGPSIILNYTDSNSGSFVVPDDIGDASFSLQNVYGTSNYVSLLKEDTLTLNINAPDGLDIEGTFFLSTLDEEFNSLTSIGEKELTVTENTKYITLFWNDGIRFLQGYITGNELELSVQSTVESLVLNAYMFNNNDDVDFESLIEKMNDLDSFNTFKQSFEDGLYGDNLEEFLTDADFQISLEAAKVADELKNTSVNSTTAFKRSSYVNAQSIQNAEESSQSQRPTFSPDSSQGGIKVEATQKGLLDLFDYDGFTELQNSSPMYLSVAAYKLDNELNPTESPAVGIDPSDKDNKKAKTYSHITSFIDRDMVAPTEYRAFSVSLWSKDTFLKVCQYQNCLIEVITPGIKNNPSDDSAKVQVSKQLFMKNLVDALILPTFAYVTELAASKKNLKDPIDPAGYVISEEERGTAGKMLLTIAWKAMPGIADAIDDAFQDNEVTVEERKDIVSEIQKMMDNERKSILKLKPGPVLSAIVEYYGYGLSEFLSALKDKVATEIAEAFVPGIGQALKVYDALSVVSDGANLAENWYDFYNMDMVYNFRVNWGLKILKLSPGLLSKDDLNPELTITGIGICPQRDFFGKPIYPDINFKDITTGFNETLDIKNLGSLDDSYSTNEQCNEAVVYIPYDVMNQATLDSKIEVEVVFEDEVANSATQNSTPKYLTFGDGLAIDTITPNPTMTDQLITITGVGFDAETLINNVVYFTSENGELIKGDLVSADESTLKVKVPANAVTGDVVVKIGNEQASSPIEISESKVTVTFGDNGNVIDDSFQLSFNGEIIDETTPGERKKTKTFTAELGEHDLTLKGITVPDQRATYYICFSNNVEVVTGSLAEKVDFPEGSQFLKTFKVKVNNTPNSNPIGCKFFDDSADVQQSYSNID